MTSTLATVFGDATTPTERPSREDMWTLLIVEMRRNNLPAPKEIRFNDGDDSLATIEPATRYDHSVWAQHFGQTVRSRAASSGDVWVYEAHFRWNGYRMRLCTYVRPEPATSATAPLIAELEASLSRGNQRYPCPGCTDGIPHDGHVYDCCGKTGQISRHESWCHYVRGTDAG